MNGLPQLDQQDIALAIGQLWLENLALRKALAQFAQQNGGVGVPIPTANEEE